MTTSGPLAIVPLYLVRTSRLSLAARVVYAVGTIMAVAKPPEAYVRTLAAFCGCPTSIFINALRELEEAALVTVSADLYAKGWGTFASLPADPSFVEEAACSAYPEGDALRDFEHKIGGARVGLCLSACRVPDGVAEGNDDGVVVEGSNCHGAVAPTPLSPLHASNANRVSSGKSGAASEAKKGRRGALKKKPRRPRATVPIEAVILDQEIIGFAAEWAPDVANVGRELEAFKAYVQYRTKAPYRDHRAAFRNWLIGAQRRIDDQKRERKARYNPGSMG